MLHLLAAVWIGGALSYWSRELLRGVTGCWKRSETVTGHALAGVTWPLLAAMSVCYAIAKGVDRIRAQ